MVHYPAWMDLATFYARRSVNNGRGLPGGEARKSERLRKKRRNNVRFHQTESPYSATSFTSFKLQAVGAL